MERGSRIEQMRGRAWAAPLLGGARAESAAGKMVDAIPCGGATPGGGLGKLSTLGELAAQREEVEGGGGDQEGPASQGGERGWWLARGSSAAAMG
jgi:hypothetical protein